MAAEDAPAPLLGRRAVLEALRAGRPVSRVLVAGGADARGSLGEILHEAHVRRVVVQTVDRRRLDTLARGLVHQGVAALVAAAPLATVDDLLRRARDRGEAPFLIALDGVEDPHNLGAVIRTAEAAGAHGVIIPRRRAAGLSPAVARASAGALAHCLVAQAGNLVAALGHLKAQGVWVVGADPAGGERYDEVSLAPPVALVVGGEGRGLHRLVRERCDRVVRIPLRGVVASLNVSVAAALLLFEVARHLPAAAAGGGARAGARPGAASARPARES
ncbi:MAG: 23S rRNA (guanosine(2251)-2'-O)-methyltransferase RlmB [Bacillati bacterium ANGP1]|uniref:23S rRNA (Guanosine(2251)-2'-O)-methyltransferase RlmB n=1 Tax=Candidatus Segetimicrobium genomatis TaxID=2569760 RepID=A0A537K5I1_9BACT|nr:MAG: 23S rRNA (guanosine(2251)-2'-O)-methyltransferase RlmB [Terrabacteria group bacterium ANGP1]